MFHTKVTLPESHPDYPSTKQSQCGNWRVIRCPDDLQSVCWTCHSGDIQSQEALGYYTTTGVDGWPIDPKHPYVT